MDCHNNSAVNEFILGNAVPLCSLCGAASHFKENCTAEEVLFILPITNGDEYAELFTSADEWKLGERMRINNRRAMFVLRRCLLPGNYEFKFRVNGLKWRCSPFFPTTSQNRDAANNSIRIQACVRDAVLVRSFAASSDSEASLSTTDLSLGPKKKYNAIFVLNFVSLNCMLKTIGQLSYSRVEVWGSWNNWTAPVEMEREYKSNDSILIGHKNLISGSYFYKFRIDGHFCLDMFRPEFREGGYANHLLELKTAEDPFILRRSSILHGTEINFISSPVLSALAIHGHSMDVIGEDIYIFGGFWNGNETNALIRIGNTSKELKVIETKDSEACPPTSFHFSMVYGQKLVVFGGQGDNMLRNYHSFFTPTNQWKRFHLLQDSVYRRKGFSSAYRRGSGRIYFFGGVSAHPETGETRYHNDLLVLHVPILKMIELRLKDKVTVEPRQMHSANYIEFQMLVFGGKSGEGEKVRVLDELLSIDLFDHERLRWVYLKPEGERPAARFGHASETIGNNLYIYGGDASTNDKARNLLNDLWGYELTLNYWRRIDLPEEWAKGRVFSCMTSLDDTLFIFGGLTEQPLETEKEKSILTISFTV